jgi:hypothetical protein
MDNIPAKAPRKQTPMAKDPAPTLEELNLPAQQDEQPRAWVKPELPTSRATVVMEYPPLVEPRTKEELANWKPIIKGDVR